jgi:hypothetical protein
MDKKFIKQNKFNRVISRIEMLSIDRATKLIIKLYKTREFGVELRSLAGHTK